MSTEITTANALTRKEKKANREAVKELAAKHMESAIKKLSEIVADRNSPASAKVAAATQLLDRVAGKPKLVDEKQTEQDQLQKMSPPELVQYITEQMSGLPTPVRAILAQSADRGLAFNAADLVEEIEKVEPTAPQGLPPLKTAPKPKREPRR
jgi:ClpP class serine protease